MLEHLFREEIPQWIDPERLNAVLTSRDINSAWLDAGPHAGLGFSYLAVISDLLTDADAMTALAEQLPPPRRYENANGLTGPFALGWIGWFGYEFGAALNGIAVPESDHPDVALGRVRAMFAFNHELRRCFMVADSAAGLDSLRDFVTAEIPPATQTPSAPVEPPLWRHEADAYRSMVESCKVAIHDGDAFQLCLTNHITVPGSFSEVRVYQRLRANNPSHHGALIRFDGVNLLSSSPEVFLRISSDGRVLTMPIKGTRRRSSDADEDLALADELRSSSKEQAENLMIVDLMRNDLSRVTVTGTVAAHDLFEVHTLPHVHQLVSTVSGQLRPEITALQVLESTFPAGSMTGAPKIAAMRILNTLEQGPRGIYSGVFGWLGLDGTCELAMVIRSIVIDERGASIGTGGGITSDSDPEFELEETRIKAVAALRALGA